MVFVGGHDVKRFALQSQRYTYRSYRVLEFTGHTTQILLAANCLAIHWVAALPVFL